MSNKHSKGEREMRTDVMLIKILCILMWIFCVWLFITGILNIVNAESINESILIALNNSTDWRTNLSTCCNWMG